MAYSYKLKKIVFETGDELSPTQLTVVIGPNNVGKSRILKDISFKTTAPNAPCVIVRDVEWTLPETLEEMSKAYAVARFRNSSGNWEFHSLSPDLCNGANVNGGGKWPDDYKHLIQNPRDAGFADSFGKALVAFLTTEHRLQLVKENSSASHERMSDNILQALYNSGSNAEADIKELVRSVFQRDIALDFTVPQRLVLRIGDDFSAVPPDPRDAKPFLANQRKLDDQGDGIRSFVGLVASFLVLKRGLYLVDEPETFLHPPHAFRMGAFLAEKARDSKQIIVASHSADILRGILSKKLDVTILRIDRTEDINTFNQLDPNQLKELATDPLLSSARVLDGLFYSGAVVVEADSDARFYFSASNKRVSGLDYHFVNADNKQTVPRITKMYRSMGVRCVGIVDFDVINNHAEFEKQLLALEITTSQLAEALKLREEIAQTVRELPVDERIEATYSEVVNLLAIMDASKGQSFESPAHEKSEKEKLLKQVGNRCRDIAETTKEWKQFKQLGKAGLSERAQEKFDKLWTLCADKGLFINPCGELESMLTQYGIEYTTDKKVWITRALQLIPSIEVDDRKNPWMFIKAIQEYLAGDKTVVASDIK